MWTLLLTFASAEPVADWMERIEQHMELYAMGGPHEARVGRSDLDGDGEPEDWVTFGCAGAALRDGDRWFWVGGDAGEPGGVGGKLAADGPIVGCYMMGDSFIRRLRLHDGVPDVAVESVSAHHGNAYLADAEAGTWQDFGAPESPLAHWVHVGGKTVPVGEVTLQLERVEGGVRVTGLPPSYRFLRENLSAEVVRSGGGVEVSDVDGVPDGVSIGTDGLLLHQRHVMVVEVGGERVQLSGARLSPLRWREGTPSEPPGPWDELPGKRESPLWRSIDDDRDVKALKAAHPEHDSFTMEDRNGARRTTRRDGSMRIVGPAGVFGARTYEGEDSLVYTVAKEGGPSVVLPDPSAFPHWAWELSKRVGRNGKSDRYASDLDGDGRDERIAIVGCHAVLIEDGRRWIAIAGPGGEWFGNDVRGDEVSLRCAVDPVIQTTELRRTEGGFVATRRGEVVPVVSSEGTMWAPPEVPGLPSGGADRSPE